MDDFPPDLSRLGRDLTSAIDRSLRRKRFRRRLANRAATVGMSGALIFVAMTPAVLESATMAVEEQQRALGPGEPDKLAAALRITRPRLGFVEPRAAPLRSVSDSSANGCGPDGYDGPTRRAPAAASSLIPISTRLCEARLAG